MEDAVEGRGKPLGPGEAEGAAPLDALARPPEPGFEVESEQPEALQERTDAELAIGFELCRDAIRLGPFVVRRARTDPARHDASPAVISAPARPTVGEPSGVGVEEGRGVLPGGEVLAADVPVHPQVAAQLQARLRHAAASPSLRRRQERVERGLEVALLGDAAFEGADLIGALDAVADRPGRAPHTGGRASARPRPSRPRPRAARAAYSPIVCSIRSRSPWPSVCTRALSTSDSSSSRTFSPGSAQTASTSANVHPPAKTAMRRNRRCSGSVEERVAPVDRGAQRLLPLGSVARAGREHVEGVVETLEQRLRRQEPQTGGGELERERQAVQAPADRRDGPGVLGRQLERAPRRSARSTNRRSPDTP